VNGCAFGKAGALYFLMPHAMTVSLSIDSAALGWEDAPRSNGPSFGLAPVVLPPLPGPASRGAPGPVGAALTGVF
jgi:hypothetical protein